MGKRITVEGYEINCATNSLGTYILTKACLDHCDCIQRIITVSSGGMYTQKLNPDTSMTKNWSEYPKDATMLYAQNKRQQVFSWRNLQNNTTPLIFQLCIPAGPKPTVSKMPCRSFIGKWKANGGRQIKAPTP